jgi:hypothetical protein
MQRRFGPTNAAGVVVIEKVSEKTIQPGQLGVVGHLGVFEKGPVGELITCPTKTVAIRKTGGLIPDSLAPDAVRDFFDLGQGSGLLNAVRVTDGNEITSSITLKNRRDPRGDVVKVEAKNPGRWGGKRRVFHADIDTIATDLAETTLDTGWMPAVDLPANLYKDAKLRLAGVPGKEYIVVSSNAATASVSLVLTVTSDSTMSSDLAAGGDPTNEAFEVDLLNNDKAVAVEVLDGTLEPTTEWGLNVYVDGDLTLQYPDLSMDPTSERYFIDVINDDGENEEIKVTDLWTGGITADVRPANHYGASTVLTATTLEFEPVQFVITSPGGGDGTLGTFVLGSDIRPQQITLTVTDDTTPGSEVWSVESTIAPKDDMPTATTAVAYTKVNELSIGFTITAGGTAWTNGDTIVADIIPFKQDALVNGLVIPNVVKRRIQFVITANDEDSLTVRLSDDMTVDAVATDTFMVIAPQELSYGYDGLDALTDADFEQYLSPVDSPFNDMFGKNYGLVKLASPGNTATAVQKAGLAYAEARNYQWRIEIPDNITQETDAEEHVNDTIGRNDFGVVAWPSFGYVSNPEGAGLKLVSLTGGIHGREALVARNFDGYHKAAAGVDVTLPNVLKLPTGERALNEELLNPQGIQVIKFKDGNAIIWGDRTVAVDPSWKWKHQRELMSHYENVLRENFDWIIFAINDPTVQQVAFNALRAYFLPEYTKGALDNNIDVDIALQIKVDAENNPPIERAAGNLNAEVGLKLADTVERFIITMSKLGIFETTQ